CALPICVGCADQHSADCDRPHNEPPDCDRHPGPVIRRVCRQVLLKLGTHQKDEQWDNESPGQNATGKLDGCEPESDDVADTQICRAYTGRGERACATGGEHARVGSCTEADLASAQISYADMNVLVRGEQAKTAEQVNDAADTDIPEEIFCGLRSAPACLVN